MRTDSYSSLNIQCEGQRVDGEGPNKIQGVELRNEAHSATLASGAP